MTHEKLVRDRIPEIIEKSGGFAEYRQVVDNELDLFLRMKIVEEAQELLESGDIEELADILEVLESFITHRRIDSEVLDAEKRAKKCTRGGFLKGLVLKME